MIKVTDWFWFIMCALAGWAVSDISTTLGTGAAGMVVGLLLVIAGILTQTQNGD